MPKRWRMQPQDAAVVAGLERAAGVSPIVARLLAARGLVDAAAARTFLAGTLQDLRDPELLPGVPAAAERILAAADRLPGVKHLFVNGWVQLAVWKEDGTLDLFDGTTFRHHTKESSRLPIVDRSITWFAGKRGHLPPAQILSASTPTRRRGPGGPRAALIGDGAAG